MKFNTVFKTRNDLEIQKMEIIKDNYNKRLEIVLVANNEMESDVKVFLEGNSLKVEAIRHIEFEKPMRTHLIQRDVLSDFENGGVEIGLTEIKLEHGYNYELLTTKLIGPKLLKVVLSFQSLKKNKNMYIN